MPKTHDIVAVVGEYEKDGQTKPKYKNCGAVIEKNGKMYIKLDAIPIAEQGSWNGWFQCFTPKPPHEVAQSTARQQARSGAGLHNPADDFDDSLPF